jgi:hypothetical protein
VSNFELPEGFREAMRRLQEFQTSPALRDAIRNVQRIQVQWEPVYRELIENTQRSLTRISETLTPALERYRELAPVLAKAAQAMREAWQQAMPPNWRELESREVLDIIDVVRDSGFALVWIPRTKIIREILAAPHLVRAILLSRRDQALADAECCLAEVTDPDLQELRASTVEAISALRGGYARAAQALAAVVFTSEAHELTGKEKLWEVRTAMEDENPEDAGIQELRLRTIYLAGTMALGRFDLADDPDGRAEFNRHNSAHRITKAQWNETNALSGIMLATALLREMEYWYALARDVQEEPDAST